MKGLRGTKELAGQGSRGRREGMRGNGGLAWNNGPWAVGTEDR